VCAALLFAVAARGHRISTRRVLREAPWQVVIFSLGMYLVVYGLKNAGLTDLLARLLDQLAAHGLWSATLGTGLLAALLSSVMNNLPSVLDRALSIQASGAEGLVREAMIYANVIGCDLGPKITPSAAWPRCCGCTCWRAKACASAGVTTSRSACADLAGTADHPVGPGAAPEPVTPTTLRRSFHASPVHVHGQQLPQHPQ
jgi:hypothetical protein